MLRIKGSFSGYGPGLQFMLLVFLGLGGMVFFQAIGIIFSTAFFPYSVADIISQFGDVQMSTDIELIKFLQGFTTIGTFMVPGLIGAYLISDEPAEFIGTARFPRNGLLVLIILVLMALSSTSISDGLYRFSSSISWPDFLGPVKNWLDRTESVNSETIQSILQMNGLGDFIEVFFLLAILPAVCEETLFRGAMQPLLIRMSGNRHYGIWITALLFALLHMQVSGFLSILVLGATLGYLREWSGSLWVPVVVHLVNNGVIVVASYFLGMTYMDLNELSADWDPAFAVPAIVVFFLCGWILYRMFRKERGLMA